MPASDFVGVRKCVLWEIGVQVNPTSVFAAFVLITLLMFGCEKNDLRGIELVEHEFKESLKRKYYYNYVDAARYDCKKTTVQQTGIEYDEAIECTTELLCGSKIRLYADVFLIRRGYIVMSGGTIYTDDIHESTSECYKDTALE